MVSFRAFIRISTIVGMMLTLIACNQLNRHQQNNEKLASFVIYTTHGVIPGEAPIDIKLAVEADDDVVPGSQLDENIFVFEPDIAGKAFWIDHETIRFVPDLPLPAGTSYEARIVLGKLFTNLSSADVYHFSFRTLAVSFELKNLRLSPKTLADETMGYQLSGEIEFSEPVADKAVSQLVTATLEGKRLVVETKISGGNTASFVIDQIERKKQDQKLLIAWDGASIKSPVKGNQTFEIAASDKFTIATVERSHAGLPGIVVTFTDQIDPLQNLNGLIGFNGESPYQIELQNNIVTLVPETKPSGPVEVFVATGVRSITGKTIDFEYKKTITFQSPNPEVRFLGKGVIMSGSSKLQLPFQTRGLKAVDVQVVKIYEQNILQFLQWNTLDGSADLKRVGRLVAAMRLSIKSDRGDDWQTSAVDLSQLIDNQNPAIYRVYLSFRKEYAIQDCNHDQQTFITEKIPLTKETLKDWGHEGYYDPEYYYPLSFNWSERSNPCSDSYYYYEHFTAQNVLATNLGIMAKQQEKDTYLFFVNHIETAEPVVNAKLSLYDYQQQLITLGTTDFEGKVSLQCTDVKPFIAIASYEGNTSFLKLDEGSSLPLSRFDVGGTNIENGQKVFMFSERDVYMPGDTLFVGVMMWKKEAQLPNGFPVVLELTNSRGQLVASQTRKGDENGLYLYKIPTNADAPTGAWMARALIGNQRFEKRLRVETIKPNRLKLQFNLPKDEVLATQNKMKVSLQAAWLQGNPLADADVSIECFTAQNKTSFDAFAKYSFTDPSRSFYAEQLFVGEGKTNTSGQFSFALGLPDYANAPGKVNCRYVARVMAPGGDISTRSADLIFSPYDSYVGLEVPEASVDGYLLTDTSHHFNLVTVDSKGKLVGNKPILVEVFKLDWSWWWSGNGSDAAAYVRTEDAVLVFSKKLSSENGKSGFNWKINYPDWGNYFVRLTNLESGHRTGKTIYLDWPSWYARNNRTAQDGATMLSLSLDKEKYFPGEKAVLSFPSPEHAKILVTVESGHRVLHSFWKFSDGLETSVEIPVLKDYSPNIYLSIMMLQPRSQQQNDLPIRLYGTIPLLVEEPESVLYPVLKLPEILAPELTFNVEVGEKNGRAMSYVLAVVDEGLLDITNFKTPDPHRVFFSKEALGLKTWDIYDLVLGAYGGRIEQVFAIGGDETVLNREKGMQSRFEPMVRILGPFSLGENKLKKHEVLMPNYIGAVRVFVVATSGDAFGHAEVSRKVKKPLMVLATAPRYLRPGDEIKLPVAVFTDYIQQQTVQITAKASGAIQIVGDHQATLIAGKGEKNIEFKMKAGKHSGNGDLVIEASSSNDKAHHTVHIPVDNPNNLTYRTYEKLLAPGEIFAHDVDFNGEEQNRSLIVSGSQMPVPNLDERLSYLMAYPYGCLEQISSQGFAQLYLHKVLDLNEEDSLKIRYSIIGAIQKIERNQMPDGGLTYWPGTNNRNEWADIFANHFMFLAFQEGYPVKAFFLAAAKKWQQEQARSWEPEYFNGLIANDLIQSYRLYLLALRGEPMLNQMNRLRENKFLSIEAAQLLSSAYSLAGQDDAARQLALGNTKRPTHQKDHQYVTFISDLRSKAIQLEAFLRLNEKDAAVKLLFDIAKQLGNNEYLNTQSVAFGLYAYQLFAADFSSSSRIELKISEKSGQFKMASDDLLFTKTLQSVNQKVSIENEGQSPVYVKLEQAFVPSVSEQLPQSDGISMEVEFVDLKGNKLQSLDFLQGTIVEMRIEITNQTQDDLAYLVLNQVIAAGWEINNNNLYSYSNGNLFDYQDTRHDRVLSFFSLSPLQSKRFTIQLTAAYAGKFLLPASFCEAMYDHRIQARNAAQSVMVLEK